MAEYALAQGAQVFGSARWRSRMEQSHTKGIAVKIDPERLRPSDVMVLEGDPSKIRRCLGWEVEIPFEHTLRDLLAYWRQRIEWSRR
jgi:GDP-D-mannose dehydratase